MRVGLILAIVLLLGATVYPASAQNGRSIASQLAQSSGEPINLLKQRSRLELNKVPLSEALTRLHETSGVNLLYSPTILPPDLKVSCDCRELTVARALTRLLTGTAIRFGEIGGHVVLEAPREKSAVTVQKLVALPVKAQISARLAARSHVPAENRGDGAHSRPVVGSVTGIVTDGSSLQPLLRAQVYAPGTNVGTLTNNVGRYLLEGLQPGPVTVRVQLIGYAAAEQTVTVQDGEMVTANFELAETALALDEIVVTGTAGGAQRRAVGNAVAALQVAPALQKSAPISFQQLLGQKVAGVMVVPGTGMVGGSGSVRIRGASSPGLTNEPLIYVDGVRIDNSRGGPSGRGGPQLRRMDDLNLRDVESIEVIKGPAAATLYGTEASNGVIQIITKRGIQGRPIWEFSVRMGANYFRDPDSRIPEVWGRHPDTGEYVGINLWKRERDAGRNFLRTGPLRAMGGSVQGGTQDVRYFLSADLEDNSGIFEWNHQDRVNTRANLSISPSTKFTLDTNVGLTYTDSRLAMTESSFPEWDLMVWGQVPALNSPTRGFRVLPPEALAKIETRADVSRVTGSVRLNYNPWEWLTNRLMIGIDANQETNSIFWPRELEGEPHFYGAQTDGEKRLTNREVRNLTFDHGTTATFQATRDLRASTSIGVQYLAKREKISSALGRAFPLSTVRGVDGAAVTQGGEDLLENKTLGTYIQQQLDWQNRLFLTGAVRGDDNSAFGANFDAVVYPKLSVAWVLNEEPFFNFSFVDALKLRGAWGQSGQQPDIFAAVRLYEPATGPGDAAVVTPQTIGNPDLEPERGTELEYGFDASLFDQRVRLEVTRFNRSITKAILAKRVAPSIGIPGSQFVNVGKVKSWGTELALNFRLVDRSTLGWDLGVNFATQDNRLEDLGGVTSNSLFEGYSLGAQFYKKVVAAEFVPGTVTLQNVMCDGGAGGDGLRQGGQPVPCDDAPLVYWGNSQPTWLGNVSTTLTLFRNFQLSATVDYQGGHVRQDSDVLARHTTFENTKQVNPITDPILQAYRLVVPRNPAGLFDAGYATLRDVSASYKIPEQLTRLFGSSQGQVTVAARNAFPHLWEAQDFVFGHKMIDIETSQPVGSEYGSGAQMHIPQTAVIMATLRLTF